jgi:F-type H+-transporting ATPase subunit delta
LSAVAKAALKDQIHIRRAQGAGGADERQELHELVDPALIGGFTLRLGDKYLDASVRRRLHELKAGILATPVNDGWWTGATA